MTEVKRDDPNARNARADESNAAPDRFLQPPPVAGEDGAHPLSSGAIVLRERIRLFAVASALAALASPACAQEQFDELDRVTVVGTRISYDDLLDTPAVSITRPGDFLLQSIVMSNDSRDSALRRRELHETVLQMISAAGGRYRILYEDEYPIALNRENYQIELDNDDKRPDTNRVDLKVQVDIGGDPAQAQSIIAAMRRFIRGTNKVGRTEIDVKGETALVMNRPERFRYEIIDAIAKDSKKLMDAMALDCKIEIDGLNGRIQWERASAAELLLYIPYRMTIGDCGKRAP
jgi:hypothetical protein